MSKAFMDKDFLLHSETAKTLYHQHAAKMPIIDYHCHIDPREIYEDKVFSSLSEVWLGGDHYKWRAMRSNGVPESKITGKDSTPYEKFEQWARTLPRLVGNPLYHWTHLELQRYFDVQEPLSPDNMKEVWDKANSLLPTLSARQIIKQSKVKAICTTDDPADDLKWHKQLRDDKNMDCKVYPAFRPDKVLNIEKPGYLDYIRKLSMSSDVEITSFESLTHALEKRLNYFESLGCRAADHGLDYIMYNTGHEARDVMAKALKGEAVSQEEADAYKTQLMVFLSQEYRKRGIVMQLHYGAVRNNNPAAFKALGPDTGFDAIWGKADSGRNLGLLMGSMEQSGGLPRTIIYSLNPTDNAQIAAMIGCFQSDEVPGKIQHGSAWWFNDTKRGMQEQIANLADFSVLANFIGMLTDSRSFLSYTRHEYFRRILCQLLADWVDGGEYPRDMAFLGKMVEDICYNNTVNYFNMEGLE